MIVLKPFTGIIAGVDVGYMPSDFVEESPLKGALIYFYYEEGKVVKSEPKLLFKKIKAEEADSERIKLELELAKKALSKADIVFMDGDLRDRFYELSGNIYWVVKSPQKLSLPPYSYHYKPHPEKAVYFYRMKGPVYRLETFPVNDAVEILSYLPPVSGYPSVLYEADRYSRIRRMDIDAREFLSRHPRLFRDLSQI